MEVNWTDNFKLISIEIDNKLALMGQNFDKAHTKAQNMLPINGRITISKYLIISQFRNVASILKPSNIQLVNSQNMITKFFIRDSDHHWISDQKLYAPTIKGGLNCIELNTFFLALQMNLFKMNNNYKYDNFWTLTLDKFFKVSRQNRISILNYGSEYFTPIIKNCKYDKFKSMLQNLQNFLWEFSTSPQ